MASGNGVIVSADPETQKAQADVVPEASPEQVAKTVREISKPPKRHQQMVLSKDYFYCGQSHEMDQILLLNRRRELTRKSEVLT
jgi:hypothetical protein